MSPSPAAPALPQQRTALRYAWAGAVSLSSSLLCVLLWQRLNDANIAMLLLLVVVLVALGWGRGPASLAACINVAVFDFFVVPPRYSFAVADAQALLTLGVMLAVGLITSQLTAGLRRAARTAASRERRAQELFDLTRELSAALQAPQIARLGEAAVRRSLGGHAHVLCTDAEGQVQWDPQAGAPAAGFDLALARRAGTGARLSGGRNDTPWLYIPLQAPMRVRGVLALQPQDALWQHDAEQSRQLDTLVRQVAIALERVHYVEVAQRTQVQMETEQLRNAVLAAISHDVRTPLTALVSIAQSLQVSRPALQGPQAELAESLVGQAQALHALVTQLLEMARLESGTVLLRRQWQSVEEIFGSAIRAARPALQGMQVQTTLPADLPLVEFDAVLLERALVNLLENAAKYGAAPILLQAECEPTRLLIRVRDHGPGFPPALAGQSQRLFDKFTRGAPESATPGIGLGLAIAKAIVDAHQGQIEARQHSAQEGGGAEFIIRLPRRAPPQAPRE